MNTIKRRWINVGRPVLALVMVCALLAGGAYAATDYLRIGLVCMPGAVINPLLCTERDLISMNEMVFESVVTFNDQMKPTPELCDEWSDSNGVWTFTLRANIQFHNGEPLSAEDVVATWNRIGELGSESPYATRCSYISAMEAVDSRTIKATGKYPGYMTLYAMAFPVISRSTLDWTLPCGTGPYWYTDYTLTYLQLDANPFWWKIAPTVQSMYGYVYSETAEAMKALSMGEIDLLATRSLTAGLSRKLANRVNVDYATMTYECLIPNFSKPLFSDGRTRKALMYAIDRTLLASNIYMDMVMESEVPVTPGSWLYETQSAVYNYSPERALQLLYEAGFSDRDENNVIDHVVNGTLENFTFTLLTYADDSARTRVHAAEEIKEQLARLGIEVNVQTVSKSSIQKTLKNGNFDLALVGVNMAVLPDLTFLLDTNGRMNYSGYSSGSMMNWLTQARTVTTESEFDYVFQQMQLQIIDDLPFMGLFFHKGTLLSLEDLGLSTTLWELNTFRGLWYSAFERH